MVKRIFIIIVYLTIILSISSLFCIVYGADFDTDLYAPENTTEAQNVGKLQTIGNAIIGTIRTIGSIASIGVLIVLGIKYMAGSVEEKAQYKQSMVPYIIGAAFVFGIINILAIIIDIAGGF
ncbi:MAG: hypothetical protein IKF97_01445 [Clostridia bacterium]|nr:hypothetical protein [Clostridia bacterium]